MSPFELRIRVEAILDAAADAWEAAGKAPPGYAFAIHVGTVPACRACGEWGTDFAVTHGAAAPCPHPANGRIERRCFLLTSIGGDTVPLSPMVVKRLEPESIWLAGHTPATLGLGPVYSLIDPVELLYLTQVIVPALDDVAANYAQLRTRIGLDALPRPLVFTSPVRPPHLPR